MKLPGKHIVIILGLGSLLVLSGCQSPQTPPPSSKSSPPSQPSSSPPSQPSSSPPSQPSSSPPSQPSSSPPSQPSSSPPSQPSSSQPSKPGSSQPSKPGSKADQSPQDSSSQQATTQADSKTRAAKDVLAKAGEQLAKAGEALQVPDSADASGQQAQSSSTAVNKQPAEQAEQSTEPSNGEPAFPDEQADQSASSQPSFPDEQNDQSASSQPSFPDEQTNQTASSQASARTEPNAEQNGAETNPGQVAESQSGGTQQDQSTGIESESESPDQDQLTAEIQAIKDAILRAGEALQTASETMSDVQPGTDNQAAEGALADARVAVIIADQELQGARDDARISDELSAELQQALENANIAIVLAGGVLQDADGEIPEATGSGGGVAGGKNSGASPGTLDDELNQSIIVFNGRLQEAKEGLPEQTEGSPGGIITGDTEAGELAAKTGEIQIVTSQSEAQAEPGEAGTVTQTGRMPGPGKQVAQRGAPPPDPEDIPDGQDDDIVARQLREAAMTEQDPDLKAKLWDEYRKYKTGISR